eukprot:2770438-Pyramimonas_sp.AAC.1
MSATTPGGAAGSGDIPLVGYADKLSVRPHENIEFKVPPRFMLGTGTTLDICNSSVTWPKNVQVGVLLAWNRLATPSTSREENIDN